MADDKKQPGWKDRNDALKIFKSTGKYGWLHLVIGQNKITKRKFLRLKRYMNWFSIPDAEYLVFVQEVLKKGAKELGWEYDQTKKIAIDEEPGEHVQRSEPLDSNVPDEVIDFIENNPEFTKKVIALDIQKEDENYLFDLLEIIDGAITKSGERFKTAFKEVIGKISEEDPNGMQKLTDLMGKWNLFQITSISNILKNRIDTIKTFENLIHDPKTLEINSNKSIHRVLEKNMWLIDENYWIVQSNKSLRTFIGDEILKKDKDKSKKRPDFACVNPSEDRLIIVEIKRPSVELKKEELDQAELYHRVVRKYKGQNYRKIDVYLIGNKVSSEAKEIEELRKGITIKTYSDFLEGCKRRYQEYLKVMDTTNGE